MNEICENCENVPRKGRRKEENIIYGMAPASRAITQIDAAHVSETSI